MGVLAFGNQSQAAPLAERGDDCYETPPQAVMALLAVESFPTGIWEPACGPGAIARVLRDRGHVVYATDLVDYKSTDQDESGWDFLMETQLPLGVGAIITNPPFKLAAQFVKHALDIGCPRIAMLLRLAFIEAGTGNSDASIARANVLDGGKLAKMYVFRNRLPMMHRDGWGGNKLTASGLPFAWFIWDQEHKGPTELHRITWG